MSAPRSIHLRRTLAIIGGVALVGAVLTSPPSQAAPAGPSTVDGASQAPASSSIVPLVSGDTVRVSDAGPGQFAVAIEPASAGRAFNRYTDAAGDLHVVPVRLAPMIPDRLDPRLFNVSGLIRAGYDRANRADLPLIVTFSGDAAPVPGATIGAVLPAGGVRATVDRDGARALGAALELAAGSGSTIPGVAKIWLDDATTASLLDASTGSPDAAKVAGGVTLTMQVFDRDGGDNLFGTIGVLNLETGVSEFIGVGPGETTVERVVPEGMYAVMFQGVTFVGDGIDLLSVNFPEIEIAGDTTVVLDAATGNEATYDVGADTTILDAGVNVLRLPDDAPGIGMGNFAIGFPNTRVFTAPAEPVTIGTFEYSTQWTAQGDEIVYRLIFIENDGIPEDLAYVVGREDVVELTSMYHRDVDGQYYIGRFGFTSSGATTGFLPINVPGAHIEWLTTNVPWLGLTLLTPDGLIEFDQFDARTYEAGSSAEEHWANRPVRPAVHPLQEPPIRSGDVMSIGILTFVDAAWNYGFANDPAVDTVAYELTADGEVISEGGQLFADITVPPGPADYELTMTTARNVEWWLTSTETSSVWRFGSDTTEAPEPLDMLQVEYDIVSLDLYNQAAAPTAVRFRPYSLAGDPAITGFSASSSIDDGGTWESIELTDVGDGWYEGIVSVPESCDPSCFVSLRTESTDEAGNTLDQDIMRAYSAYPGTGFGWDLLDTGSTGSFRGLDAVSDQVAWAANDDGEVLRTVDGGATFENVAPPEGEADGLLFRDVEARSTDEALVLAIGAGEASRIYRTTDGGASWEETFRAENPASFFDCMAMFDARHGLVMGDPVDGKFQILITSDRGKTWTYAPESGMPDALAGEFAFAASGTCLTATGKQAFFGTGGGAEARVFRTVDFGLTWSVSSTPMQSTEAGGIFSLDFRTNRVGIAIGGDFTTPEEATDALARSTDHGVTWVLVDESVAPDGYRSGLAWYADKRGDERATIEPDQKIVFAVGPTGSDVSFNRGKTWQQFDGGAFHSVECVEGTTSCWASGPDGRIAVLTRS
jgi:photosystem II stability/assembly factor-like uncharacterized protein